MATIVLSAVGAAAGSAIGGSVLGLSATVIGRAVGATLGRVIDQKLLGSGSAAVETGKVDRFRLTGASEGSPVSRCFGRTRLAGQVIWSSRFKETKETSDAGKGAPEITEYSYSVSMAIALCEGEILRVGRIWADGIEILRDRLNLRVYPGTDTQLPDPKIEAIEGAGMVPAYRGVAYVVIENLLLDQFGNRVPQFSFEVVRPAESTAPEQRSLTQIINGVALIPGTGEYALGTTPVHYGEGPGAKSSANVNSPSGKTDFVTSLEELDDGLPECGSALLVASWFGDDLRCGQCKLRPKVTQTEVDGANMPWNVSGQYRGDAHRVPEQDGKPVYGGTPNDKSVIEAISSLKSAGKEVVFYPFILMDQVVGNTLPDPWTGDEGQPALPWRGRITTERAPGVDGSTDQTADAEAEVAAFFGTCQRTDFDTFFDEAIVYTGPQEWSYRRFILHYAHLCAAAGGVAAFCIGSEMRSLTQVRGANGSFPAVTALMTLAADVRAILGPNVKITYAADWSEYFGYHPQDGSGDVYFHLDPLWAAPEIDFIGIDNYMPLSDWRDEDGHADAHWGSVYDLGYLQANVEGGEGYDWYYPSQAAAESQRRVAITDGAYGEDWVFRYKDIRSWWLNSHHDRIGGVRQEQPSDWVAQSKPVWFTEYGCAAIDKGTNQPNKFLDPKSSESSLPAFSSGVRDDFIQQQYLRAINAYWGDSTQNPVSEVYGAPMIDMSHAHVWAWDTRPYPYFPANSDLWSDGENYFRGHWLNGRAATQSLAAVVTELCAGSGVEGVDTSALYGGVRGYTLNEVEGARSALQPLMLAYGFDAVERDGQLVFKSRGKGLDGTVQRDRLAVGDPETGDLETTRAPEAETAGRVRLNFVEADADYEVRAAEAIFPDDVNQSVSVSEVPLVLTQAEGRVITERWLAESRVARDRAKFSLPISELAIGAGDVVQLDGARYRIDRVEHAEARLIEAIRVEPDVYTPSDAVEEVVSLQPFVAPVPVYPVFMDLPLLTGAEVEHAPHLAVTATPWPGSVALFSATQDSGYALNSTVVQSSVIGVTQTPLFRADPSQWDRGDALRVQVFGGELTSVEVEAVLNGANAAAIGDGTSENWEVIQFAEATLVGADTYELRMRLRGQAGSEGVMPDVWPVGSILVLLDGVPQQIGLSQNERGLARHYRIGPAGRAYEDPSYIHKVEAFSGIGLRPYAPCHLRVVDGGGGDLVASWVRRTRVDGDSWDSYDVPLGEAQELYQIRVRGAGNVVLREAVVSSPNWTYDGASQANDGAVAPFAIEVAQISERYGAGLFERIEINE
ncbi:baseplate multidomain protein megatron [Actibacterium lipolyticum]|uniref:Host specificity protein n=1 Tax=Actibacterium lipolyticum TaxID=1524263 RepID=A0A238KIV7_9RHOB|nr:glycoside hydrolase/phage tail family protein [Actibacterium lipolyticum]SMX42012.1 hypothetical protein COL8621_01871 [Actibacterium lipolyticum]